MNECINCKHFRFFQPGNEVEKRNPHIKGECIHEQVPLRYAGVGGTLCDSRHFEQVEKGYEFYPKK